MNHKPCKLRLGPAQGYRKDPSARGRRPMPHRSRGCLFLFDLDGNVVDSRLFSHVLGAGQEGEGSGRRKGVFHLSGLGASTASIGHERRHPPVSPISSKRKTGVDLSEREKSTPSAACAFCTAEPNSWMSATFARCQAHRGIAGLADHLKAFFPWRIATQRPPEAREMETAAVSTSPPLGVDSRFHPVVDTRIRSQNTPSRSPRIP